MSRNNIGQNVLSRKKGKTEKPKINYCHENFELLFLLKYLAF